MEHFAYCVRMLEQVGKDAPKDKAATEVSALVDELLAFASAERREVVNG